MPKTPGAYMDENEPAFHSEVSVEKALNSRCSSDNDGDQKVFHWGMYDLNTPIPPEYIGAIEQGLQIPRFTTKELHVELDKRPIVLSMYNDVKSIEKDWLSIESGMQHQAVHLVCAVLGMGTCIHNLGTEGTLQRNGLIGTAKMVLNMMLPSYNDLIWSVGPPSDLYIDSGLPAPRRDSEFPLLKAMEDACIDSDGKDADASDISQLLWAARGRTPHYIMGKPYGLTIPTWAGGQNIASVFYASSDGLYQYVNTIDNKSAHSHKRVNDNGTSNSSTQILLAVNESTGRGLWEVGYMLENLILQATAVGIRYKAVLFDEDARKKWEELGIKGAKASCVVYPG
ncbi:hypothetical protein [uncultured Desulfobulbus sp.]|uniref:hypothetical protein n=1 Tax=uncultured Desulfobulbus sp. TaxID=239745 RepID=UPI0029C6D588|nr:hypothetical protein [uncultured Desulfobulbus sp.]